MTTLKFDEWQDVGGTPVLRINAGVLEAWDGSAWVPGGIPLTLEWLVVAGGGGGGGTGGAAGGAGGGAGGFRTSGREGAVAKSVGDSFTVTVGAGGAGGYLVAPGKGEDSVFDTFTSEGGGPAGWASSNTGGTGGSSGGGYANVAYQYPLLPAGTANTAGARQGNKGCNGMQSNSEPPGAGGGAGGEATTGDWDTNIGSAGGQGLTDGIISGTLGTAESVGEVVDGFAFFGGGGGGAGGGGNGAGGIGGGGGGGAVNTVQNGQANTGGGGSGGRGGAGAGNGGSGVVILSLPEARSLSVGAGLVYANAQENDRNIYIFKSGTGTVTVA